MSENNVEGDSGKIQTEIRTDIEYDGEGTVYAVKTARQGKRRVDFKIGHIDGTYAEGYDFYYDDEVFSDTELYKCPENAPSARYRDEEFSPTEWAEERLEEEVTASEVLEDDWLNYAQDHFENDIE